MKARPCRVVQSSASAARTSAAVNKTAEADEDDGLNESPGHPGPRRRTNW